MPGWKWRHESPSPEPEDLTVLEGGELDMDFTPSEVDALEAIDAELFALEDVEPDAVDGHGPFEHTDDPEDQLCRKGRAPRKGEKRKHPLTHLHVGTGVHPGPRSRRTLAPCCHQAAAPG